jgi:hypothetical protein
MNVNFAISRCLDAVSKIADKAAKQQGAGIPGAHTGGLYRMIMLAVGATLLAIGLDGEEGEHAVLQGGTRLDVVNQTLTDNKIGYRLVELQRPRGAIQ